MGKRSARELASQLMATADTLPIGQPVNMEDAARRNVLLKTANLLVRQSLPPASSTELPRSSPSIETLVHTMHVTPEQAHAATLMRTWVAWDSYIKGYAAGSVPAPLLALSAQNNQETTALLHSRATATPQLEPSSIPQSQHCPLKLVAVREREFGAQSSGIHIGYYRYVSIIEGELHGPRADKLARPSSIADRPDVEHAFHWGEPKRNIAQTSAWTGEVGSVRWFEITAITFPSGKTWHSSPTSRCIYIPLDPAGGTDWQSVFHKYRHF